MKHIKVIIEIRNASQNIESNYLSQRSDFGIRLAELSTL